MLENSQHYPANCWIRYTPSLYLIFQKILLESSHGKDKRSKDLHRQNISLLTKWGWKLETQQGLWQEIIHAKYFRNDTVPSVKSKFGDSPIWKALLKVKEMYMARRKVIVNNGNVARLWHDPIGTHQPLGVAYPTLFSIANYQEDTIAQFTKRASGDAFRRRLNADMSHQLSEVKKILAGINTSAGPDKIVWGTVPNGKYTTKSMYSYLERDLAGCDFRWIWRARLPTKIQIFLWQLFQDAVDQHVQNIILLVEHELKMLNGCKFEKTFNITKFRIFDSYPTIYYLPHFDKLFKKTAFKTNFNRI